ncbi:MAG: hypothetical protein AB9880_04625 [Christensenellales bacterium]
MIRGKRAGRAVRGLEALYLQCRQSALSLSLACALDEREAFAQSRRAFVAIGQRRKKHPPGELDLLRVLWRRAKRCRAPGTGPMETLPRGLPSLDMKARAAWALCRVGALPLQDAAFVLNASQDDVARALDQADAVLHEADSASYLALLATLQDKREIFSEISFRLEQRAKLSHRINKVIGTLLAVAAGLLLLREARLAIRVLGFPGPREAAVLAQTYDDAACYKRYPPRLGGEEPRIDGRLWDTLAPCADDTSLRVAFRFYDRDLMEGIRDGGRNLLDIYLDLYALGLDRGRVHTLMARAIELYYKNYKLPFQVRDRKEDFRSDYASIYAAALAVAQDSSFAGTLARHPEIFGTQADFDAYLTGPRFSSELPQVAALCQAQMQMDQAAERGEEPAPPLRERYETLVFAFHNPNGIRGSLSPAAFSYTKDETDAFFPLREKLGRALYDQTVRRAQALLPGAMVTSDVLEGNESSLMSATLEKAEILRLAREDDRFYFLGVAAPHIAEDLPGLEHGLAAAIAADKRRAYDIYMIDEEYLLYSVNYAAPLTLPQGFIDQFRALVPSADTLFEQSISYTYQMRFAHPQQMAGWLILRASYVNPALNYALQDFKYFSKMDRY